MVISPDFHEQIVAFDDGIGVAAKGGQQLCFAVCELFLFVGTVQQMITDVENKMPQLAFA